MSEINGEKQLFREAIKMIYITGDTHGEFGRRFNTQNFPEQKTMTKDDYVIICGDYYKDLVCELRENGKALRYSPYELYGKSKNYEETIDEFIKQWETVLQQ